MKPRMSTERVWTVAAIARTVVWRWLSLLLVLTGITRGWAEEVVFAVRQPRGDHWYENFGHAITDGNKAAYGAGGHLCKLDVDTGKVTALLADPQGSVRDPQVHYDGNKILFATAEAARPITTFTKSIRTETA